MFSQIPPRLLLLNFVQSNNNSLYRTPLTLITIYEWECPLPIKPDPHSSDTNNNNNNNTNPVSTDDSVELDSALSLAPEDLDESSQNYALPESTKEQTATPKNKRFRIENYTEQYMALDSEINDALPAEEDPTLGFKLPASKSPIMEAMVVCALNGWGLEIVKNNRATSISAAEVMFRVTDFNRYYKISRAICSKHRPTDDLGSRIKSLRRWFVNFPKKKDRCENSFYLLVKPNIAKKVNEIIERNSRSMGLSKRRRTQ